MALLDQVPDLPAAAWVFPDRLFASSHRYLSVVTHIRPRTGHRGGGHFDVGDGSHDVLKKRVWPLNSGMQISVRDTESFLD
ncbi:MAG TPA: hypothetical protein VJ353_12810, partial [Xanthobacteraceae bacterium]|nr:hypothetical protein [Xanthobacteraceae bacterium]